MLSFFKGKEFAFFVDEVDIFGLLRSIGFLNRGSFIKTVKDLGVGLEHERGR